MSVKVVNSMSEEEIYNFLLKIDELFFPALRDRVNLTEYSTKLYQKAQVSAVQTESAIVSAIFYYTNTSSFEAYIPILGTINGYEGRGYIKRLMKIVENDLVNKSFSSISLETWKGSRALNMYIKNGYFITSRSFNPISDRTSILLKKDLRSYFPSFGFCETPLETNSRLNETLGVDILIKRDDLFPVIGGGSKARKLKYILKKAVENGCTAVVTAGSNHSNHLRATAIMCAELGLKFTACIHDTPPSGFDIKSNIKLTMSLADRAKFMSMRDVKREMDDAVNQYVEEGESPLYIWGGGHCIEGTYAYYKAVEQLAFQCKGKLPDFIFVASGTGTTQAGIVLGASEFMPRCTVIGVSIAREKERGKLAVSSAITDARPYLKVVNGEIPDVIFDDSYLAGGYAKADSAYTLFLMNLQKRFGLVLDPTYSGKAFNALNDYVLKNKIEKGARVLFWNTGGIFNI